MRYIYTSLISFIFIVRIFAYIPYAKGDQTEKRHIFPQSSLQTNTVDPKRRDLWDSVPNSVKSKIIAQELKIHPEVHKRENEIISRYIKIYGSSVGMQAGKSAAIAHRLDWINTSIVDRHESIIWGHVDKEFEKRDKTVIKTGDYLALYKLSGKDAVLFWGPVAATDQDHVKAGMSPGDKYNKCSLVLDLSRNEYVHARPT